MVLYLGLLVVGLLGGCTTVQATEPLLCKSLRPAEHKPALPLQVRGGDIVDGTGTAVRLRGIAWSGMEGPDFMPDGLWARRWRKLMAEISKLGFNTLRLGYSNSLFARKSRPRGFDTGLNYDLVGLSPLQVMDRIVDEAGRLGLMVILSRHRTGARSGLTELWYTSRVPEKNWLADWRKLAERYKDKPWVIGADIANEPHGRASWGTGSAATDWRLAAERAGKAILDLAPHWLIFVQGIGKGDSWWGSDLRGVADAPVRLPAANLVYASHVFGPEVYPQRRFYRINFPDNLAGYWDRMFGYLAKQRNVPVMVGSFGVINVSSDSRSGRWFRTLVDYIHDNRMSFVFWALNPNSKDTGGILKDDWRTVERAKLRSLFAHCSRLDPAK